jgi:hypothetical protein
VAPATFSAYLLAYHNYRFYMTTGVTGLDYQGTLAFDQGLPSTVPLPSSLLEILTALTILGTY